MSFLKKCKAYLTNRKIYVNNSSHREIKGMGMAKLIIAIIISMCLTWNLLSHKSVDSSGHNVEASGITA